MDRGEWGPVRVLREGGGAMTKIARPGEDLHLYMERGIGVSLWRYEVGPEAADRLEEAGLDVESVLDEACESHQTGRMPGFAGDGQIEFDLDPSDLPRSRHECADCKWRLFWHWDRATADRAVAAIGEGGQ